MIGFVLEKNINWEQVTRDDVRRFIKAQFDIVVTARTAGNVLNEGGLSLHTAQYERKPKILDEKSPFEIARDFLADCRARGLLKNTFASVDFTYTSHREAPPKVFFFFSKNSIKKILFL